MKIVLLGPPGSGKGTQAKKLEAKYEIPHISTGDIFRDHIRRETDLGKAAKELIDKGKYVPDDIVMGLVKDRILQSDCKNGYLFDGFPRTIPQAEMLEDIEHINKAIHLTTPDEIIVERMKGRRMCKCGATYHIENHQPKKEGICDICGKELYIRDDDNEETVRKRLLVYHKETAPLVEFYKKHKELIEVDGTKPIMEVFEKICKQL